MIGPPPPPPPGCCGGLECNRKGGRQMEGGMGVCEKPKDGDGDEDKGDEAKVRAKVYL